MQNRLRSESVCFERILPTRHLDIFAIRIHIKIAVARAKRAVALDDLLLMERRGERDRVSHRPAMAERVVCLRVGSVEGSQAQDIFGRHFGR